MSSSQEPYAYPVENPYVAIIVVTPQEFKVKPPACTEIPVEEYTLKIPDSCKIPEIFIKQ